MPGFFVADGAYQNTRAPNPKCCSDPKVMCLNCAKLALGMPASELFDYNVENARPRPFFRASGPVPNDADFQDDVADMTPPTLSEVIRNERQSERPGIANARDDSEFVRDGVVVNDSGDDYLMIPPSLAATLRAERRSTRRPPAVSAAGDDPYADDVRDMTPPTLLG